jgi:triphosphoribosyl-dephospho-CoA synthase
MTGLAAQRTVVPDLSSGLAGIGKLALHALHAELVLAPKPGLVTPYDNGSHTDMNAHTFMRSLFSLRGYFVAIAHAGARDADFAVLQQLGIAAEARMLRATDGVNTHRGAIFSLGLLAAAAGRLYARGTRLAPAQIAECVRRRWGAGVAAVPASSSHGAQMRRRHGAGGARAEAATGFPTALFVGLPALRRSLAHGAKMCDAQVDMFFALLADVADTNILYRGGEAGLAFARAAARRFVHEGGTSAGGWRQRADDIAHAFVARDLSPGGSADLFSVAWYLHRLESMPL